MTWVKLDDGYILHRKVAKLGPDGVTLHVALLCYSAQHLTDGFIPKEDLKVAWPWGRLDLSKAVRTLISAGLVEETKGGYQVHDYLEWQPSRAEVIAKREKERAKKAAQRGGVPPGVPPARPAGTPPSASPGDSSGKPGSRARARDPVPSRPVPSELRSDSGHRDRSGGSGAPVDPLTASEELRDEARRILTKAYARHFERPENGNDLWMSSAANDRELRQVATYLSKQSDMEAVAEEIMAGFFADPWARSNRWPLKRLAKDPSRFRTRNGSNGHTDPEVAWRKGLRAEQDAARQRGDFDEVDRIRQLLDGSPP